MPAFDGTGPRGQGVFTGRGQGYCVLRLPEPGSGEPAIGYAGIQGTPLQVAGDTSASKPAVASWPPMAMPAYGSRSLWPARYAGCVERSRRRGRRWGSV